MYAPHFFLALLLMCISPPSSATFPFPPTKPDTYDSVLRQFIPVSPFTKRCNPLIFPFLTPSATLPCETLLRFHCTLTSLKPIFSDTISVLSVCGIPCLQAPDSQYFTTPYVRVLSLSTSCPLLDILSRTRMRHSPVFLFQSPHRGLLHRFQHHTAHFSPAQLGT
ncbi:hypothetical protein TRVL_02441 [Trypanosoma vivax]|nr:hypothetical protein TRVL_02441 [Trypanosoma vivax]